MPTYEYRCPKCGTKFDEFQKMSDPHVAKCPKCGAKAERQLSAGAGLVFKGSGFYLTDYGRAGQKSKKKETGESSSTEKKPESGGSDKPSSPPSSKPKDDE